MPSFRNYELTKVVNLSPDVVAALAVNTTTNLPRLNHNHNLFIHSHDTLGTSLIFEKLSGALRHMVSKIETCITRNSSIDIGAVVKHI